MATKQTRVTLGVRISKDARGFLDTLAGKHGVDKSEVARAMLTVAGRHLGEVEKQIIANKAAL